MVNGTAGQGVYVNESDDCDSEEERHQARLHSLKSRAAQRQEAARQQARLHAYREQCAAREQLHHRHRPMQEEDWVAEAQEQALPGISLVDDEKRWAGLAGKACITYCDIPWPPTSDYEDYLLACAATISRQKEGTSSQRCIDRKAYGAACLRWHPDKFLHRYGRKLAETDRGLVLDRVQEVAKGINAAWDRLQADDRGVTL